MYFANSKSNIYPFLAQQLKNRYQITNINIYNKVYKETQVKPNQKINLRN